MHTRMYYPLLVLVLCLMGGVPAVADIIWDFENGNDHGFTLWSVVPPIPGPDDPDKAGDEALTGGLPNAGVAWNIGSPAQFDGLKPGFTANARVDGNGRLLYSLGTSRMPADRGYLNTYSLNQHGDAVHTKANDQIATSPFVLLAEGAKLFVTAGGGGSGTHAPTLDPNPSAGYTDGSAGLAVRSAADGTILASVLTNSHGTLREDTVDLSAYAGRKVYIDVVDAFDGSWGWLTVDIIRITNAVDLGRGRLGLAGQPVPADQATDVPLDMALSWAPGKFASAHNVYFGTDFDDVNKADTGSLLLVSPGQDANSYDPGLLELGTTYYWRVDEVNAPPDSAIFKGPIWSFTTEPYAYALSNVIATASSSDKAESGPQNTVNGSGLTNDQHSTASTAMWLSSAAGPEPVWVQYELDRVYKLHELWVWNYNVELEPVVGYGFKDVAIEYSLDGATWTLLKEAQFAQASAANGYAHNTAVALDGVMARYVRLTAKSNWSAIGLKQCGLSEVRFFHVPLMARDSEPANGTAGVAPDVVLNWRAGREATSHKVYLGTDQTAVTEGTAAAVTVTEHSYTPAPLALDTTYFWRVDEIGAADTYPGDEWSFSTAPFQVVDNFEGYTNNSPNRVFQAWIDGYGFSPDEFFPQGHSGNGTGAMVGYDPAAGDIMERTIVHGSGRSMPLAYDNTGSTTSEAIRTFDVAQDWTASGIKSLSLWFCGAVDNAGQLYVKINNAKIAYSGGAADIKRTQWQAWNIDLSTVGGNLRNVTSLTIGIEGPGATGTVYIDDIRLYPKTPELLIPVEPAKTGLLAEYLFDNGANDTSGKGHHGTFLGEAHVADSRLVLDGTDDAVSIPQLGGATATHGQCTYSMWMYSLTKPVSSGIIGGINIDNWTADCRGIHCKLYNGVANVGVSGVAGGDLNGTTIVDAGEWIHLGLTVTQDAVTLYLNGQVEAFRSFTGPVAMILGKGCIGAYRNNNDIQRELKGQMDDVRIYNRAVSLEEMLWLAGRREPVHKPF